MCHNELRTGIVASIVAWQLRLVLQAPIHHPAHHWKQLNVLGLLHNLWMLISLWTYAQLVTKSPRSCGKASLFL
jgi:hypothetical protein